MLMMTSRLVEFLREWERTPESVRADVRLKFRSHYGFYMVLTGTFTVVRAALATLLEELDTLVVADARKADTLFVGDLSRRRGTSLKLRMASTHGVAARTEDDLVTHLWQWLNEASLDVDSFRLLDMPT